MFKKLLKLPKHTLFKGSLIILVGTAVGNFLNYLYHFASARFLTPGEYGLLQSLISLTYFQSVLVGAFSTSVIEKIGSTNPKKITGEVKKLETTAIKISLFFWLAALLTYPLIKKLLHLDSFHLFLIFSLQILFAFLAAVYGSTLQAQLKFLSATLASVSSTAVKLISVVILLGLGAGVIGGLSSWLIWRIFGLIISGYLVRRYWKNKKFNFNNKLDLSFLKFSFLSLIVNLSLTSLYTSDVIFARHYLNTNQAGLYAALSNLGKIIFFGSSTIMTVAFPMFVKYRQKSAKLKEILKLSLLFCLFCCVGGVAFYFTFPELAVKLLYGNDYLGAAGYLFKFAIFISLYSLFNLLVRFLLALRSKFSALISLATALVQIILIIFSHQNIFSLINVSLISVAAGLIICSVIVVKSNYVRNLQ